MCVLHFKSTEIWVPKIFAENTGTNSWLFMHIGSSFGWYFRRRKEDLYKSLYSDWFSFILLSMHQQFIALTRDYISPCSRLGITSDTLVSSTNFHLRSNQITSHLSWLGKVWGKAQFLGVPHYTFWPVVFFQSKSHPLSNGWIYIELPHFVNKDLIINPVESLAEIK